MKIIDNIIAYDSSRIATEVNDSISGRSRSKWTVDTFVHIFPDSIQTKFRVYDRAYDPDRKLLFETDSLSKLLNWIEEHKSEIQ